ncbi:hypothetical protein KV691_18385 [Xanthomonas euvesicatoria pv. alangii]|uniref:hypothetical protein n=1 Tax=Xanthomonas euvesicatoria TaxID=456327 RepID=UPI001C45423D|nr:hypothetical protein [Xanthomonas euvesicatoria]MBV6671205.1 hypothetical protein [Xanthomonas euvesicatoria pv. alangii]
MSTHFSGEGNIGSPPEYREFPNGNDEPRRLLRLNVYFDNLPFRIESVALSPKSQEPAQEAPPKPQTAEEPAAPKETKRRK